MTCYDPTKSLFCMPISYIRTIIDISNHVTCGGMDGSVQTHPSRLDLDSPDMLFRFYRSTSMHIYKSSKNGISAVATNVTPTPDHKFSVTT